MFSVIIPYYKKRKYIERCINSVLAQTYQHFEIILVDDGSNDDIAELINKKYSEKVHLIQQQNQGVSAARNTGIVNATQDYIAFLDADDYWSPAYLNAVKNVLDNDIDTKIVGVNYAKHKLIKEEYKQLEYSQLLNYFKEIAPKNTLFTSSSTVIKKVFFENNQGFNPQLKSGEDIDVWFRAVLSGGNAYYIHNTLVFYSTEDENQATKKTPDLKNRLIAHINEIYYKDGVEIYPEEFYRFLSKFIYSGLFRFYNTENEKAAKEILNTISYKYFFAELYYRIPILIKHPKISRRYFKFLFRYIY